MTDDLLKEEDRRLLLFSVSSDGDLRGWDINPENVRDYVHVISIVCIEVDTCSQRHVRKTYANKSRLGLVLAVIGQESCSSNANPEQTQIAVNAQLSAIV